MIPEQKMTRMMARIALGNDLAAAKKERLVTNAEEEEIFLSLEREVTAILAAGGTLADFGFANWTDD